MSWAGEWMCCRCQHLNFKKRDSCHKCGLQKFCAGDSIDDSSYSRPPEVLPGDWYCSAGNCGAHNYASRASCRRCGSPKYDHYYGGYAYGGDMMGSEGGFGCEGGARPGWKLGDWICARQGCGEHNYASRTECHKCRTPKDY